MFTVLVNQNEDRYLFRRKSYIDLATPIRSGPTFYDYSPNKLSENAVNFRDRDAGVRYLMPKC